MTLTDRTKELGRRGEELAAEHFSRLGYRVLDRNHRTRFGELDLVLADEGDGDDRVLRGQVAAARLGRLALEPARAQAQAGPHDGRGLAREGHGAGRWGPSCGSTRSA